MTVTFISNYLNHHQIPFCEEMHKLLGDNFHFIETTPMEEDRIKLGWKVNKSYHYTICSYKDRESYNLALQYAENSDVVIIGAAPITFVKKRIKENKLTFAYSERFIRKGIYQLFNPGTIKWLILEHVKYRFRKNMYMLCASAYTSYDCKRIFAYPNRTLKWGYFPELRKHDQHYLFENKSKIIEIIWVGRFLNLKHPEEVIEVARRLKQDKIEFKLTIIGNGAEENKLKKLVTDFNLNKEVLFLGQMKPEEVRKKMEKANIFLFTSDFNEGWGAVLNEAMNSGCAVVASHAIGSTNFLINDGVNGYVYENGGKNELYFKVKKLVKDHELRKKLGKNAVETINTLWNPVIAAKRFIKLSESILYEKNVSFFKDGPCSKAEIVKNNWYKSNL